LIGSCLLTPELERGSFFFGTYLRPIIEIIDESKRE